MFDLMVGGLVKMLFRILQIYNLNYRYLVKKKVDAREGP